MLTIYYCYRSNDPGCVVTFTRVLESKLWLQGRQQSFPEFKWKVTNDIKIMARDFWRAGLDAGSN